MGVGFTSCAAHVLGLSRKRERAREKHPLLNWNSCASATAAAWHFRWPRFRLYGSLELTQTTMASHQKRKRENRTLLSAAVEISVRGGEGGTRPLASLSWRLSFYYWKHTHSCLLNKCQLTHRVWYLWFTQNWNVNIAAHSHRPVHMALIWEVKKTDVVKKQVMSCMTFYTCKLIWLHRDCWCPIVSRWTDTAAALKETIPL